MLAGAAGIATGAEQHAMCAVPTDPVARDARPSTHRASEPICPPLADRAANDNHGSKARYRARPGEAAPVAVWPSVIGAASIGILVASRLLMIGYSVCRVGAKLASKRL